MIQGCDLYHGDPMIDPTKFDFVFHKATQGTWFTDPACQDRIMQVREAGKLAGMYHFMTTTDPIGAQVQFFIQQANPQRGDVLALDLEDDGHWASLSSQDVANMATSFINGLVAECDFHQVLLYCDKTTYGTVVQPFGVPTGDGLWIASVPAEPQLGQLFWQYGSDIIDYDRGYFVDLAEALRWSTALVDIPQPGAQQKLQLED